MSKELLNAAVTLQSASLLAKNLKELKNPKIEKMMKIPTRNIVGIELLKAQSNAIAGM